MIRKTFTLNPSTCDCLLHIEWWMDPLTGLDTGTPHNVFEIINKCIHHANIPQDEILEAVVYGPDSEIQITSAITREFEKSDQYGLEKDGVWKLKPGISFKYSLDGTGKERNIIGVEVWSEKLVNGELSEEKLPAPTTLQKTVVKSALALKLSVNALGRVKI